MTANKKHTAKHPPKCVTKRVQRPSKVPDLTSPCCDPCKPEEPVCRPDPVERFCPTNCPSPEAVTPTVEEDDLSCGEPCKKSACK